MPGRPARWWSRAPVWAVLAGLLAVDGACGRVGYDGVAALDGAGGWPDASGDCRDLADQGPAPFDLDPPADTTPVEVGAPDLSPLDMADQSAPAADVRLETMPSVDGPPDLASDVAEPAPIPPVFADSTSAAGGGNQLSYMHDGGNGRDRYLVVGIALETEARNVTAVSFGGRALTRLGADVSGTCGTYLYGLANPPTGNNPLAVNLSDTSDIVIVASSFTGVRQTATQGAFTSRASAQAPIALVVPSAAGDHVVDNLCLDDGITGVAVGAGQTERGRRTASTFAAAMSSEPGAPSVTMSWTFAGTSIAWASAAVSLKPAAAMAIRLERRQMCRLPPADYTNRPGSGPVVRVPKLSAPPPNRL